MSTTTTTTAVARRHRTHPLRRATLVSSALAGAVTAGLAGLVHAAGVPLAVNGEMIPVAGFAQLTVLGGVLGGVLATALNRCARRPRRRFLQTTAGLAAFSCAPSIALPPDTATRIALVATHLIAAAIIVPMVARHVHSNTGNATVPPTSASRIDSPTP